MECGDAFEINVGNVILRFDGKQFPQARFCGVPFLAAEQVNGLFREFGNLHVFAWGEYLDGLAFPFHDNPVVRA